METEYYSGTRLLSQKDINGNTPEIFLCTSNRNAGKTTWFSKFIINKFIEKREKFAVLYRYNYELDNVSDKIFKDVGALFFRNHDMSDKTCCKGIYHELFLDNIPCGYAISINSADQIKRNSHLFSDTKRIYFDEFQSETNHYCPDEVTKFQSIHRSLARGQGEQVRYLPVYMTANPVTMLNPYYIAMGISTRLRDDVKFLRGPGYVLEQGYNESADRAQALSGFNQAFANTTYSAYASQGLYLNDNQAFIEKPSGVGRYLATLRCDGKEYALREYAESGIIYCDNRVDETYPYKLSVTTEDHRVNYVMLQRLSTFIDNMRYLFDRGCFRFKDLQCKETVLKALSY